MQKKLRGFTLVELMVTIAVAAILLAIGVPSLTSIYESVRVNNNITKIHDIMVFARSQAISYGIPVTVSATNGAWKNGIKVVAGSKELRVIDAFNSSDSLKEKSDVTSFSFTSEGILPVDSPINIIYCPGGEASNSKSVTVSISGLISYGTDGNSC
ncbi:GspH/FimT family pseudopilin [Shewanella acanthi]|uniref:GspH/FimT family pseudopilin n=1 Tax=Shewanella acanthi TaxID=2864212 RepID=UPI001C662235|nr:GspH/FimT family pseudopilin [Shewanella acanthi]QYJ78070.1 GspH/FimT family pseudopilin [Shewanella acanthi]